MHGLSRGLLVVATLLIGVKPQYFYGFGWRDVTIWQVFTWLPFDARLVAKPRGRRPRQLASTYG